MHNEITNKCIQNTWCAADGVATVTIQTNLAEIPARLVDAPLAHPSVRIARELAVAVAVAGNAVRERTQICGGLSVPWGAPLTKCPLWKIKEFEVFQQSGGMEAECAESCWNPFVKLQVQHDLWCFQLSWWDGTKLVIKWTNYYEKTDFV